MHSPSELRKIFELELERETIRKSPQSLYDPVNYILSLGGKRIRPVMLMMTCEMFGGEIEKAMPAALGIEMFHNFSLVHDDIMDRAPIRRGKTTVHEKWNANAAILSGDTMLVLAYEYFLRLDRKFMIEALKVYSRTAKEVCEGQQFDMDFESSRDVRIDDYLEMIRLKTAVLIGAAFELGAIIAGADEADTENIYRFGENAGLAFQLMDDLLDTYGDEKVFGKKQYGDIRTNKKTFLYLKALEMADAGTKEKLKEYYTEGRYSTEDKISGVIEIFDLLDVKSVTEASIRDYHDRALDYFSLIRVDEARKKAILGLVEELMSRSS